MKYNQEALAKPKVDAEETLGLDSDGEIVERTAPRPGHKNYYSTKSSDKSEVHGYRSREDEIVRYSIGLVDILAYITI